MAIDIFYRAMSSREESKDEGSSRSKDNGLSSSPGSDNDGEESSGVAVVDDEDAGEGTSRGPVRVSGSQRKRKAESSRQSGGPSKKKKVKSKSYTLEEEPGRHIFGKKLMKRYNGQLAQDTVYSVSIARDDWRDRPLMDLDAEMRLMWADVLRAIRRDNVLPSDLIRIHISHRDLPKGDIIVPLQRMATITVDSIMDRISTVMQSFATLKANDRMEISVGIIRFPRGEGRFQMLNLEEDLCKKKSVTIIDNSDGKCLSRALICCDAYAKFQRKEISREMYVSFCCPHPKSGRTNHHQERHATALIETLGLTVEESSSFASLSLYEEHFDVDIVVISANHQNKVIYPEQLKHASQYYVYYLEGEPGHFHAVKTPQGLMGMSYFCKSCLSGYTRKHYHRCSGICEKCKCSYCEVGTSDLALSCMKCGVEFKSLHCFENHLAKSERSKSICEKFWQCKQCRRYYDRHVLKPGEHSCGTYLCTLCEKYVPVSEHRCYQRFGKSKKSSETMIFFDFETVQDTGEHIPNLVVARRYRMKDKSYIEYIVRSSDVRQKFGSWLFSRENKGSTVLAHNLKGFDGVFLLNYLVKNNIVHEVIYSGTKIMNINVHSGLKMRVIDSLNFFPMPLSKMPTSFGLENVKKGDFPHLFNRKENFGYIGKYPSLDYYSVDSKSESGRKELIDWHAGVRDTLFYFERELLSYCRNDVKILAESCLRFREDFMKVTEGLDPFSCMTIASATMSVFKRNYLREEYDVVTKSEASSAEIEHRPPRVDKRYWTSLEAASESHEIAQKKFCSSDIALVPSCGYLKRDNYSYSSIAWLKWLEKERGLKIQHALSLEGEFRVPGTNFRVDGYCKDQGLILEYYGCLYHGCRACYHDNNIKVPKTNETRDVLFLRTRRRENILRGLGYRLITIWEHDFREQIEKSTELQQFLLTLDIEGHINLRQSFFGGRTNACRLYYAAADDEIIRYLDFTSLYPYVNKYKRYPIGHPEIIVKDFADISTYFGIAKIKILPPKQLYHPVLPVVSNGKLKFPLCFRCATAESQRSCRCTDGDRALKGTWCTPEIEKALKMGYRLLKIYQVYHYSSSAEYNKEAGTRGIFSAFIDTFLKIKQENSGWPIQCTDEASKADYVRKYQLHEGIRLDPEKIEKNPGMRSLAKLILNSFWGKFGQRSDMQKHKYVRSQAEFLSYLLDETTILSDFHIVNEDLLVINYGKESEFIEDCPTSNVTIASFTTCWARLKLYEILQAVGRSVLYFDTDSVIFVEKKNEKNPVLTGDYLGQLTDELKPGNHIVSFVSGGPKNYAYLENDGSQTCKVKGFTLNYENSQFVNFETIRDLVLGNQKAKIHLPARNKICRDKYANTVYNRQEDRNYSVVYTKRRIVNDYDTLPFGYVDN